MCDSVGVCVCFSHCSKSHSSPKQRRLKFNFGAWKLPKVGKKKKNEEDILDKGKLQCIVATHSCGSFLALSEAVSVCVGRLVFDQRGSWIKLLRALRLRLGCNQM